MGLFKRRDTDERGQILVIVAVGLVIMVAMVGIVIDGGYAWGKQRETQNGSDAASEAGALLLAQNLAGTVPAKTDAEVRAAVNSRRGRRRHRSGADRLVHRLQRQPARQRRGHRAGHRDCRAGREREQRHPTGGHGRPGRRPADLRHLPGARHRLQPVHDHHHRHRARRLPGRHLLGGGRLHRPAGDGARHGARLRRQQRPRAGAARHAVARPQRRPLHPALQERAWQRRMAGLDANGRRHQRAGGCDPAPIQHRPDLARLVLRHLDGQRELEEHRGRAEHLQGPAGHVPAVRRDLR